MNNHFTSEIAGRFREVMLSGTLVANTNFKDQLLSVEYEQAIYSYKNLNSIAKLTFHINYYIHGVMQVLKGGKLEISDKYSFDMNAFNEDEDWINLRSRIFTNAEEFSLALESLPDSILETHFVKEEYGTYRRNMEVMIEHCYYHLGQIVLLRKLSDHKF